MEFHSVSPKVMTVGYQPDESKELVYSLIKLGMNLGSESAALMLRNRVTINEIRNVIKVSAIQLGFNSFDAIFDPEEGYADVYHSMVQKNSREWNLDLNYDQAKVIGQSVVTYALNCLLIAANALTSTTEQKDTVTDKALAIFNRTVDEEEKKELLAIIKARSEENIITLSAVLKGKRIPPDNIYLIYHACYVNYLMYVFYTTMDATKDAFSALLEWVKLHATTVDVHCTQFQLKQLCLATLIQLIGFTYDAPGNSREALAKLKKLNRSKGFGS